MREGGKAEARARQPDLRGTSFATIAGFNANGALPHYHATPETNAVIELRMGTPPREGMLARPVPRRRSEHTGAWAC